MSRRAPGVSVVSLDYPASEGSQEVWFGLARVVVKTPADPHEPSKLVANEFICARLAMALGIPVPMGDAGRTIDGALAWVSAQVELDGQVFPPADLSKAATGRPSDVAAMVAFDVWVNNEDRHEANVIYHPEVGLWAIDFELSLGGNSAGDATYVERHKDDVPRIWAMDGVALDRKHFAGWAERIKGFPRSGIISVLDEARSRGLLTAPEAKSIRKFLEHRQTRIRQLLSSSMGWSSNPGEEEPWQTLPAPGTS